MNISDQARNIVQPDTSNAGTSCFRNPISDITFYDSANLTTRLTENNPERFPFNFIEQNKLRESETRILLENHLKEGWEIPLKPFHDDWLILVIVAVIFLYGLIGTISRKTIQELTGFFNFRSIGDPAAADSGALFRWESTLINLVSFISISLFVWCVVLFYEAAPSGLSRIVIWIISFGAVIVLITLRHLVCIITGNISGEREAFGEYLLTVYQSYRFLALIMFFLVVLIAYTDIFSVKSLLVTGFILFLSVYLIRITRLLIIFLNRNISVLYLILYLCALEFLPVVVSVKFFAGMF